MLSLTSELLASTAMLFALNSLFKEIEFRLQRDSIVHNVGFFTGVASLFVITYWIFLPGLLIILAVFTRLDLRKACLLIFGFALPHILIFSVYLLRGDHQMLITDFYSQAFQMNESAQVSASSLMFLCFAPVVFFLLSLVMLNREARLTKYQSQLMQVMFIWILLCAAVLFFSKDLKVHHLIIFIPPLSYFISHYILLIRRKRLAELTVWAFILAIVSVLYLTRYDIITSVNLEKLFAPQSRYGQIKDKRVLPLMDDWGLLKNNQLATGFYEWRLSESIFKELDYYENVMLISKAFETDTPDIIIDPNNLMPQVVARIPALREKYRKEGDLYVRISK
jgi:hypothetical protein